jgi:Tol biopolymer transport system component
MRLRLLALSVLSLATVACKDSIEVPEVVPNASSPLVYNQYDRDNREVPPSVKIADRNGTLIKDLGPGAMGGIGENAIAYQKIDAASGLSLGIYVADSNGENSRLVVQLTKPGQRFYGNPSIAANGSLIAYATRDSISELVDHRVLHVVRVDGSGYLEITNALSYETRFAVSPDGSKVAYFKSEPGVDWNVNSDLMISNTNGTGSNPVATGIGGMTDYSATIAWAPDGQRLAYGAKIAVDEMAVFVVAATGGTPQQVALGTWPSWSPNGQTLAWTGFSESEQSSEIYISNDLGLTSTALTATAEFESHPIFSPDGGTIMCTIWEEEPGESNGRLVLLDVKNKTSKMIAQPIYGADWIK